MTQLHPYNEELSYHFANLALTTEAQPLWENGESNHPELDNIFAIPRQYYDELFLASQLSADAMYEDIHDYIFSYYEQIGAIRIGVDIIPDYVELDNNWTLSEIDSFDTMFSIMDNYSRRFAETLSNSVRYGFSKLLMGYALRSKVDGHGIIVIRGTVTLDEWLNNINYRLFPLHPLNTEYGQVHKGFRDVYKGIRGVFRQLVDEFDEDRDIYFVGHSLGGAVAQIAALDIVLINPERANQIQVYAYASPRTGDSDFAKLYNEKVRTSYRIVNVCDSIPYMPFEELGAVLKREVYPYADTKGEMGYVHQAGNPVANHISSYHLATRYRIPAKIDASFPRRLD